MASFAVSSALDLQIGETAAHVHAGTARLCDLAADYDERGDWKGVGMRSCAHWLTIATGIDLWTARAMVLVGHALRELPLIHAAFTEGRLSFDKVRALTHVAAAADEETWVTLALEASGAQLARICRAFRHAVVVDDPARAELQRVRRRLVSWWLEDGMLSLQALLPPEEGRIVLTAVNASVVRPVATCDDDPCTVPEPDDPAGALRADALTRLCREWLDGSVSHSGSAGAFVDSEMIGKAERRALPELVVHVDLDTLTGADAAGRCHLEDGPAISVAAARRIGCDARVVAVLERQGTPVHVGSTRRIVPPRLRRLLHARDQGCAYPGCGAPVRDTEAHHVDHWSHGGPTTLENLVSLCRFHHHRHHEGLFEITAAGGGFAFAGSDGRPIGAALTGRVEPRDRLRRAARDGP